MEAGSENDVSKMSFLRGTDDPRLDYEMFFSGFSQFFRATYQLAMDQYLYIPFLGG